MNKILLGTGLAIGTVFTMNVSQSDALSYYTTTSNLNVRTQMSTSCSILGTLPNGTMIQGTDMGNGWLKTTYKNQVAYVSKAYTRTSTQEDNHSCSATGDYVTKANLNLRSGCGTQYKVLCTIPAGSTVRGHMRNDGWTQVNYKGAVGYVSTQYLKQADSMTTNTNNSNGTKLNTKVYRITAKTLNVRAKATSSSNRLGYLYEGQTISGVNLGNGWIQIKYNGYTGYISSQYATTSPQTVKVNDTTDSFKTLSRLVIVNKTNRTVSLYRSGVRSERFNCCVGKRNTPTPNGKRVINDKVVNKTYYQKNIEGGSPNNPLGSRWIGLGDGYGIHGTNQPDSISTASSNGCVRLKNVQVNILFDEVEVGDIVIIGEGTDKQIAQKYGYKVW